MGSIVHIEITANDLARANKFYEEALGWKMEDSGMPGTEYWLTNSEGDGIEGAIMPKTYREQPTIATVGVTDIDETIEKVKQAGGEIINEIHDIPGVGKHVYIKDTEGNVVGLLQPNEGSTIRK